jgi:hypothetical protein
LLKSAKVVSPLYVSAFVEIEASSPHPTGEARLDTSGAAMADGAALQQLGGDWERNRGRQSLGMRAPSSVTDRLTTAVDPLRGNSSRHAVSPIWRPSGRPRATAFSLQTAEKALFEIIHMSIARIECRISPPTPREASHMLVPGISGQAHDQA